MQIQRRVVTDSFRDVETRRGEERERSDAMMTSQRLWSEGRRERRRPFVTFKVGMGKALAFEQSRANMVRERLGPDGLPCVPPHTL